MTTKAKSPIETKTATDLTFDEPERYHVDRSKLQNLSGKQHPTWPLVLDYAHTRPGASHVRSIRTELVQIPTDENNNVAICKAVVEMDDGSSFESYGDASPSNVNRMVAPHVLRMAETRAKGRALRDAVNIGEAIEEELGTGSRPVSPLITKFIDNWKDESLRPKLKDYITQHHGSLRAINVDELSKVNPTVLASALGSALGSIPES